MVVWLCCSVTAYVLYVYVYVCVSVCVRATVALLWPLLPLHRKFPMRGCNDVAPPFSFRAPVNRLIQRGVVVMGAGYGVCSTAVLCAANVPPDLSVRAWSRVLTVFGGKAKAPGTAAVQKLYERLVCDDMLSAFATSGCLVRRLCVPSTDTRLPVKSMCVRMGTPRRRVVRVHGSPQVTLAKRRTKYDMKRSVETGRVRVGMVELLPAHCVC